MGIAKTGADDGAEEAETVQARLVAGVKSFKKEITPGRLKPLFEGAAYQQVVDQLPWEQLPAKLKNSFNPLVGARGRAGQLAAQALPQQAQKELRFDVSNPRLNTYIKQRSGSLIVEVTRDTKRQVKTMVRNALTRGDTPRAIADQVKGLVGLTERQAGAVVSYRRGLQAQGLAAPKVQELAAAYEERTLDRRGMAIGVTETRFAVNLGQQQIWDAAVEQDLMPADTQKRWLVEDNPCPVCAAMEGTTVDVNQPFTLSDGQTLQAPPAHPLCKCSVELDLG